MRWLALVLGIILCLFVSQVIFVYFAVWGERGTGAKICVVNI